jgi:uncharacterized tellurite resistance protein B-like protein
MNANVAKCLLVSKVLVADGIMTENERMFLEGVMRKLKLTDAERQSVINLENLDSADGVVAALPMAEREDFVHNLLDAASADGRLSPLEAAMVKSITAALGVT